MKKSDLDKILKLHALWLLNNNDGQYANLFGANLSDANLSGANLSRANLSYANLSDANLSDANLSDANLSRANLSDANLSDANLSDANLSDAKLSRVNLSRVNLSDANLRGADLSGADLSGAKLPIFQIVPETGNFIAYKKVKTGTNRYAILTLEIVGKRTSSLVGRKCRTDKTKVLKAEYLDGKTVPKTVKLFSKHDSNFKYLVGKTITCEDYNDDIRLECTTGIHFFITKKEAIEY